MKMPRLVVLPEPGEAEPGEADPTDPSAPDLGWIGKVVERTAVAAIEVNGALLSEAGAVARRLAVRLGRDREEER